LVCGLATKAATAGGAMRSPADTVSVIATMGGGGSAATSIKQPVQQSSAQA
jgi:hypothetical protein